MTEGHGFGEQGFGQQGVGEQRFTGTNRFRMYPSDEYVGAESDAVLREVADGCGHSLEYSWMHPTDGPQRGVLLFGRPADDGVVTACLLDSWHQRSGPVTLRGVERHGRVEVGYEYGGGWGWLIDVGPTSQGWSMTMSNVIPPDADGLAEGAYEVMVAAWDARLSTSGAADPDL